MNTRKERGKIIGFSTGVLHEKVEPISEGMVDTCGQISFDAIELNCSFVNRLENLGTLSMQKLKSFQYISLHAPCDIKYKKNRETREVLAFLERYCQDNLVQTVVFHPDLIEDASIFDQYKFPKSIENMDWRKKFGKTSADLNKFFDITDFEFVLDINHCLTNDDTMQLADELIEKYRNKLCEIHLSGFEKEHEQLFQTKQDELIDKIKELDVPIIIESDCGSSEEMEKEFEYIVGRIKKA